MTFDQSEYDVRCEWGPEGVSKLAPASDVVVVVDVLSFSTSVDIACGRGATVFPYRWKDETAYAFAEGVGALVADGQGPGRFSLSPSSLLSITEGSRIVLPSPNGSTISLLAGGAAVIAGCLRNCRAVAEAAAARGSRISIIPAGERWEDGSLRPCVEDLIGAGAIISHLPGKHSPEARLAEAAFEKLSVELLEVLRACGSGREKIERGEGEDVELAAGLDVSRCVPVLDGGAFRNEGA